jgi:DNA-binding MarR family transcriptional regulator
VASSPDLDCPAFRLSAAFRRVDRHFNRALAGTGLTNAHAQILICLLAEGELRVADIAHLTGFDHSTVSRLVKELTRRKLVRRRAHPDDARARLLRPAARAEAWRAELARAQRRFLEMLRRSATETDLGGFRHVTEALERLP